MDKWWTPVFLSNHAGNAGSPHSQHLRDAAKGAAVGPRWDRR